MSTLALSPRSERHEPVFRRIAELITSDAWVAADRPIRSLVVLFDARPDLDSVAVIEPDGHVGIVCRSRFFLQLGKRFGYALFENRPIRMLMEEGSTVEANADPVEVITVATQREPARLYDDIVVLEHGTFRGIVSMRSLMAHHKELLFASFQEVASLDARNRQLEETNRVQTEFMANMTHELRTPLNTLLGVTELMRRDPGFPTNHHRNLDRLRSRGLDLLGIINNILDMSALQAGAKRAYLEEINLPDFLDEVLASAHALAAGRTLHVGARIQDIPTLFVTDSVFLRRILGNLLGNAIKFTEAGSVTLAAQQSGDCLVLSVADTGVGIAPADCERLFTRFTQLDCTRSKRHAGTGLGLAIVKGLAEELSGTVGVHSTPGEGSTFSVRLPVLATTSERP